MLDLGVYDKAFSACSDINSRDMLGWCFMSVSSTAPREACDSIVNVDYRSYCLALNSGVKSCADLSNFAQESECVFRFSRSGDDKGLCFDIGLDELYEWCLVWSAISSGDVDGCAGLEDRDKIRFCNAVLGLDSSLCTESKDAGMEAFCLAAVGFELDDISVCEKASRRGFTDRCYVLLGHLLDDPSACSMVEDRDYLKLCNALVDSNLEGCGLVSRPSWVDLCDSAVAYSLVEGDGGVEPWVWFMLESMY
ncbi:MAG: hypothetical protein B6U97_02700 [Candidatus Altiarchaeales archaeon ex4484_96]|nr:MAG: hypothetical protein B6U97_02700 [Candidatus Altiarchaeales archaeon ex4484_96]